MDQATVVFKVSAEVIFEEGETEIGRQHYRAGEFACFNKAVASQLIAKGIVLPGPEYGQPPEQG